MDARQLEALDYILHEEKSLRIEDDFVECTLCKINLEMDDAFVMLTQDGDEISPALMCDMCFDFAREAIEGGSRTNIKRWIPRTTSELDEWIGKYAKHKLDDLIFEFPGQLSHAMNYNAHWYVRLYNLPREEENYV